MHNPTLNLRQLELFVAAARSGGLAGAAAQAGVTRAAASMGLSALERAAGGPLFIRTGRGLRPNDRGRRLLPGAEGLVRGAEEWLASARGTPGELTGDLRVGCSLTVGGYCLPPLLPEFRRRHPRAGVSVRITNSAGVAEALRTGAVDIGIIESDDLPPDLQAEPWGWDEMVVVAPPGHPLARSRAPRRPAELSGHTWLVREPGSGTLRAAAQFLTGIPRVAGQLELGSTEAVKQGVVAGLGLALLSAHTVAFELESGRLAAVPLRRTVRRPFHLLRFPGQHTSSLVAGFYQWLRENKPVPLPVAPAARSRLRSRGR